MRILHRIFVPLLALASLAAPAAAEVILLDCDVTMRSESDYLGRRATSDNRAGEWRFRIDTEGSRITLGQAAVLFEIGADDHPFLVGAAVPLNVGADIYLFCLERNGSCSRRTPFGQDGSWYDVELASIDRRRGSFRAVITHYYDLLQGHATHTYSGACRRVPEQQF